MGDRVYAEISTAPGFAVRVSRSTFRRRVRADVRHVFEARQGDPDSRLPTKKGISLPIDQLPQLLAALHKLEAEALADGALLAEDYENAGLEPLAALRDAV